MVPERDAIDAVADEMLKLYLDPASQEMQHIGSYELPSDQVCKAILEKTRALMFPGYAGPDVTRGRRKELRDLARARVIELRGLLSRQVYLAHHHKRQQELGKSDLECVECQDSADRITDRFLLHLPELHAQIKLDLHFALESDPAATGIDEILFCYPGTYAITVYRIAHALLVEGALIIPRIMTEIAHRRTGVDIHPRAEIGKSFFIDHGTGVVIGETSKIGDRCRIYQGVTLGGLTVPQGHARPEPGKRRHPTLEDEVVVYANATILGGDTIIGKGAVIGGNSFVTSSVAPGAKVSGRDAARSPDAERATDQAPERPPG